MSSGPAHQQGVVDALVQSVLKRDLLFVLYHLKELEPSRINQVDTRHRLSPLQAALSLPQDGPRRALLLQIFLLSGAYLSLAERLEGGAHGRGPSEGRLLPHWARGTEKEAAPARMLLYDISLEEAERWLRKQGLDVVEVYNAAEARSDRPAMAAYPTPPAHPLSGGYDPSRPQYGDARPPYPPSRPVDPPFPSHRPPPLEPYRAPFAPERGRPAASQQPPPHHHRPPSPSFQPGPQTFVLEGLANVTTSVDLARFLGRFFKDDRLVEAITLAPPSRGTKAFKVVLSKAVDVRELELLNGSQLDGASMRVQVEAPSTSFPTSAPRPLYHDRSPPPRRASLNERRRSLSPRRPIDNRRRDPSPPRSGRDRPSGNIWAPHSSCIYAYDEADRDRARPPPPPREGATQEELSAWAEESFVGRWAADFPGVRPKWEKGRGMIWRGELCPAFPPRVGGIKPCWGRNCNHAHAPEELRIDEHGTLRDPAAAAAFAKRPWRAPPIAGRSTFDARRRSPSPPRLREDRPPPHFDDRAPPRFNNGPPSRFNDGPPPRFDGGPPPRFDDRLPPRFDDRGPPRFIEPRRALAPPRFGDGRRSPPRGDFGRR